MTEFPLYHLGLGTRTGCLLESLLQVHLSLWVQFLVLIGLLAEFTLLLLADAFPL